MINNGRLTTAEHLYIHLPFCRRICDYCDFFKTNTTKNKINFDNFIISLKTDFLRWNFSHQIKTIFIGGGTPNSLSLENLEKVLTIIKDYVKYPVIEYSIELNPECIYEEQLILLKKYNINRLSVGIQSTNREILLSVNRDNGDDLIKNIKLVKKYFSNFSFDFIYNLPKQTTKDLKLDFEFIRKFNPTHISWYSLILKENTPLAKRITSLSQDADYEFYLEIDKNLKTLGYKQYEISNYSKTKNFNCLHNICYWKSFEWIGIGPSACGFYLDQDKSYYLQENSKRLSNWQEKLTKLSEQEYLFQKIMMGLRLKSGIDIKKDRNRILHYFKKAIDKNIAEGLLLYKNDILKTTRKGFLLLNNVLQEFL